jgi:hypothetical protein
LNASQEMAYSAMDLEFHIRSGPLGPDFWNAGKQALSAERAFFVSATGFIGLVPANTRFGVRIYVILGADVPYVVRKTETDGKFTLIGECYVVGLMHGEAMKDFSKFRD